MIWARDLFCDFVVLFARDHCHLLSLDKTCHGMALFAQDGGRVSIPALLGWYEFTFRMDEGPEPYANRKSQRGTHNPGGGGGGGI